MSSLSLSDQEFRALSARITELLAEFYARLSETRACPQTSGAETRKAFEEALEGAGLREKALDGLGTVMELSRAPTGRFFGYVLGSGEPVAALGDWVASALNQNVTAWRSAPAATAIERQVVRWIAGALGCDEFTGSLCGGGSAANLMGLAMAREARLPANDAGARPGQVYVSSEAHMSITKAVALLGLGRSNLRVVGVDDRLRLSVTALDQAIAVDRAAERSPIAVVATAGTVSTGVVDPLEEIGAVCRKHGLWLHVDGAYGALAALVRPELFRGLSAADSLSVDLHKWLYQPVECGMLLFRDPSIAQQTFSHTGEYARVLDANPEESTAFFDESLELSRRFRALKVWLSLRYHGIDAFREAITRDLTHARQLAADVQACRELELLAPVELSAVCFRCRGDAERQATEQSINELNAKVLQRVVGNGRVYLSNALVHGKFALRACFVNHRTTEADVAEIVPEVLRAVRTINPSTLPLRG